MTGAIDTSNKQQAAALAKFVAGSQKVNPHKINVPAAKGCSHAHVRLVVTTFKGAGGNSYDEYQDSRNGSYPVAEITNESQDCASEGLHLPPGQSVVWWISGGTAYVSNGQTGSVVAIGNLYECTNGTHGSMGDNAFPKAYVNTCDHKKPPKDDDPEGLQAAPAGTRDDIDFGYDLWVNCSDTCCYTDPGFPLERQRANGIMPPPGPRGGAKKS